MTIACPMKHRHRIERVVLRLVRGDRRVRVGYLLSIDSAGDPNTYRLPRMLRMHLAELRDSSEKFDLHIFSPESDYVSTDELYILGSLAARQHRMLSLIERQSALDSVLTQCAEGLTRAGILLPQEIVAAAKRIPAAMDFQKTA